MKLCRFGEGRLGLVDDGQIAGFTPEVGEPSDDDGLIVFLFGHWEVLLCLTGIRRWPGKH